MKQYIAPQVLLVKGKISPCECAEDVVCAYCTQANLLLWERRDGGEQQHQMVEGLKKYGVRRASRAIGVRPATISGWIKQGRITPRYEAIVTKVLRSV